MSASGSRRRTRLLVLGAKVALSLGLIALLLARIRPGEVAATLRGADVSWLAAAWALMLLSNLLGSYQWEKLLRVVEIRIPFWRAAAYYHIGLFFNNFLPANIGGDLARITDSSRHGPTKTAAVSAVLMDRLVGSVALAGLALLTTLAALDRIHFALIYLVLVGFLAGVLGMLWAAFHPALAPACARLMERVGLGRLAPHLSDLAIRLQRYRGERALFVRVFAVAILIQVSRIGVHALVAKALGLQVPLTYFFLFVPLLAVIVSLPISLNGIGVREGAGVVVFGLVGVDRAAAFSLQLMTYLVAVAVSLLGGLVFLLRIPHRHARARNLRRNA